MNHPLEKRETLFYALAFLLALTLRLIRLGAFPLTDVEAGPALQALQIAQGTSSSIGPNSAYVLLTSALFFLFESSNFLARLIPALAGCFLVFTPLLFRQILKPGAALLLAFFLALDPGLLAISRQAGSAILGLTFLLLTWGFGLRRSYRLAGMFAALTLLSGPSIWTGLLGLGLSWPILQSMQWVSPAKAEKEEENEQIEEERIPEAEPGASATQALKLALPSFLATLVLFGTLLLLVPGGINGALAAFLDYLRGWTHSSSLPGSLILLSLVFYQPLALIFCVVALIRGWVEGNRLVMQLTIWMLVALLLAVFYPAHMMQDLVWMLVPLLALAALELSRHFDLRREERVEVPGVAALTVLVMIFAWLDLSSMPWNPGTEGQANLRLWLMFGALFLLAISLVMVAIGWSSRTARMGAVWGFAFFFGLFSISAALAAGRLRVNYTAELWGAGPYPRLVDLLVGSVSDLSEWSTGQVSSQPVTIYQYDSPALRWALRTHKIIVVDTLDPASAPPLLITPFMNNPGLAASYRGQDFSWNETPNWDTATAADWLRWAVVRDMPQSYQTVMLWVRDDLFLDSSEQPIP